MKDVKTKQKFLELRAQGKSLRAIEKEIGTGRQTLATWEHECKGELKNMQAIEFEALREEYSLTTRARLELLGGQLRRMREELEKRDLSDIPTLKLLELVVRYSEKLNEDFPAPEIKSDEEIAEAKSLNDMFSGFASN